MLIPDFMKEHKNRGIIYNAKGDLINSIGGLTSYQDGDENGNGWEIEVSFNPDGSAVWTENGVVDPGPAFTSWVETTGIGYLPSAPTVPTTVWQGGDDYTISWTLLSNVGSGTSSATPSSNGSQTLASSRVFRASVGAVGTRTVSWQIDITNNTTGVSLSTPMTISFDIFGDEVTTGS